MNRRAFIGTLTGSGLLLAGGGTAWVKTRSRNPDLTLEAALVRLNAIRAQPVSSIGAWSPFTILTHTAQSVLFSMQGYPEQKSRLFQAVVGQSAFAVFSAAEKMHHNLAEPIPGAPGIATDGDSLQALDALIAALTEFDQYTGALQPHFAYGALSKQEYALAHVLHLNNHWEELQIG